MIVTRSYTSPVGELLLASYNEQLLMCDWKYRSMRVQINQRIAKEVKAKFTRGNSPVIEQTITELEAYFSGKRKEFTVPFRLIGTDFQQNVWRALQKIPYGKTVSYLALAKQLNNEKAVRAVASANGANALSLIIPCHRVIGSKGELTGYAGGLTAKKKLLGLENNKRFSPQTALF